MRINLSSVTMEALRMVMKSIPIMGRRGEMTAKIRMYITKEDTMEGINLLVLF